MEITEAFQNPAPMTSVAIAGNDVTSTFTGSGLNTSTFTGSGVNTSTFTGSGLNTNGLNTDPTLLGFKNFHGSPKRLVNCNGHAATAGFQIYRGGEISFIPLEERGVPFQGGKKIKNYY